MIWGLAPAAAADGSEEAPPSAALAAPEIVPAVPEPVPFFGNVELKARLDAAGRLTVAGERMHSALLRRFYAAHGYQLVWDAHPAEMSRLRDAVLRADAHGLDPGLFHGPALVHRVATLSEVERDLLISDAFLSYADALSRGAMPIEDRVDDEDLAPEPVDVTAVLDAAIAAPNSAKMIEALARPPRNTMQCGGPTRNTRVMATTVPAARVRPERASAEGAAANEKRQRQLVINLERLRWLPRQMPRDRVVVNAAIARLQLIRDGRPVFTTRVVVGEIDKQTPEFRSAIDSVLFNPPWNIPRSIAQKEILPKLSGDPNYLRNHHMRYRSNGSIQQEAGPVQRVGAAEIRDERPLRRISARHADEVAVPGSRADDEPWLRAGRKSAKSCCASVRPRAGGDRQGNCQQAGPIGAFCRMRCRFLLFIKQLMWNRTALSSSGAIPMSETTRFGAI